MTGKAHQDRDKLLITGIPPVADAQPATRLETPARPKAVFVDSTGWRARLGRRLGLASGAVLVVCLGAFGLGMTTAPSVPLTSWGEPSPRPQLSRPDVPSEKPRERRVAANPQPTGRAAANPEPRGEESPPPASATPSPTAEQPARPAPTAAASPPGQGKSQANPPAWGRKKKDR